MTRLGIVTGLPAEAALVPRSESLIVCCDGPGPEAARRAAERAVAVGAAALLSFGLAGGLDPSLAPGTLVLAREVVAADGTRIETDPAWRDRLATKIGQENVTLAAIAAADAPVADVAEKRRLFAATGAAAADMESGPVAETGRAAGLPFLAVRAIADPADRAVPPSALAGLNRDGTTDVWKVVRALLARPGDLSGLLRLAGDYRRATRCLGDVALRAGAFGFV